ncbi:hypothetical protein ACJJI4_00070 [Microbulbifer sp. TRSA002]|uniref:hypothetical protein n=1 Tax=Microbulbifer sp. TRSA002 TaxID=3243382 RepID=UPI0040394FCF
MMCFYCRDSGADSTYIQNIEKWADEGLVYSDLIALVRPSAVASPNTFVFVFENAVLFNGRRRTVYVDVHYVGDRIIPGAKIEALGGLWVPGINGMAMKPQQHGGELYVQLMRQLPRHAPKSGVRAVYGDRGMTVPLPSGIVRSLEFQ